MLPQLMLTALLPVLAGLKMKSMFWLHLSLNSLNVTLLIPMLWLPLSQKFRLDWPTTHLVSLLFQEEKKPKEIKDSYKTFHQTHLLILLLLPHLLVLLPLPIIRLPIQQESQMILKRKRSLNLKSQLKFKPALMLLPWIWILKETYLLQLLLL